MAISRACHDQAHRLRRWPPRIVALTMVVIDGASCSKDSSDGVDRELLSITAGKAVSRLQESAATLGGAQLAEPIEDSMSPYLVAMKEVAQSFPDAAGGDRKVINTLTYVGMGLATANATQAVGGIALTGPYTFESRVLDELLKSANEEKVKDFDSDELVEETSRLLEMLGEITILGTQGSDRQDRAGGLTTESQLGQEPRWETRSTVAAGGHAWRRPGLAGLHH